MPHLSHVGRAGALTSRSILVLLALIATMLVLVPAARAAGGDYTYFACSNPDTGKANGGGVPSGFTNPSNDVRWQLVSTYTGCGTAGQPMVDDGILLTAAGIAGNYPSGTYTALHYAAPANVSLLGGTLWRALSTDSANSYAFLGVNQHGGDPAAIFGLPRGDQGDWFVGGMNRGVAGSPFASAVGVQHAGDQFNVTMACIPNGNNGDQCTLNGLHSLYRVSAAKLALRDSSDPQISASSGTLLTDATMKGDESVTLSATDVGSGLYRVRVLVGGALKLTKPVALNNGRCTDLNPANGDDHEFDSHVPCKPSASGTYTFDTSSLPDGTHTLAVQVEDAGGNTNTLSSRQVAISNHSPSGGGGPGLNTQSGVLAPPLPGSVPGAGVGLAHTFNGELAGVAGEEASACAGEKPTLVVQGVKRGQLTLRYGQKRTVKVALTCASNNRRIRNATLELSSRVGKRAAVALTRETDRDGVASIAIGPGPSRTMTVGYRMYGDDANPRAQATLRVKVIAKATIKASKHSVRNGQPVVLRGKLVGGHVPRRGVNLLVQWKDGKRWRPFSQVKTDRAGRYRYAYRFTRTNRTVRYQLRVAVANGQVDYPFAPGASRAIRVTVAP